MDRPEEPMSPWIITLGMLGVSLLVAVVIARRLVRLQSPVLVLPDLAPDADRHLALLLRANHALGVWVLPPDGAPRRSALATRLGPLAMDLVGARLPRLAKSAEGGAELLEAGVLVFLGDGQSVAAALLPAPATQGRLDAARRDLAGLLDDARHRPILAGVARQQERPHESAESVALRLAHQLERLLDTEVAVALVRPVGVQVMGVSLRSEPRLLLAIAAPGSALERVARGNESGPVASDDPLGRAGSERRRARPSAVILPIPGDAFPVGAVVLSGPSGELPGPPVRGELLQIIAQAGPRLTMALEHSDLAETANSDPLTGLRNRRGLDSAMSRMDQRDGVLIYADLDHFKKLNDTLGHAAGDSALVHCARLILQLIRTRDVAARIGGEEYAIWLPDATLLEGAAVAERIRGSLAETPWGWQGRSWEITASFGVAGCPETVPGISHLATRADEALYEAKRTGRNRVVTAM
jgi:diguanylate cyclase (GGDEF)-like protein